MAFGFFRKTQAADMIYFNGQIYTHDPEFPWADAVACKDGKIFAVGEFDAMDEIIGKNTEKVDLEGKYLFPGFIDVHRSPVMKVFEGKYLDLSQCTSPSEICRKVNTWAKHHKDAEVVFGYGFPENIEPEMADLDKACKDRPVLLLAASGIGCSVNTLAEQIIEETAEEECVEIITVGYVLNLLVPFDFEEIEASVSKSLEDLCRQGITSVLDLQTPDYFEGLYQDSLIGLYSEGEMKQRFFGAYLMNRPLQPRGLNHTLMRRKTNCNEMSDMIQANILNVYLNERTCPMQFPQEALDQILPEVADKGFDLFIEAADAADLKKAYHVLETVRNNGYKNTITIASNCSLPEEDRQHLEHRDEVLTTWATDPEAAYPLAAAASSNAAPKTAEEALDELTIKAATILGMEDELGKVEKGMYADFAVFEENPLEKGPETFAKCKAAMTVLGGKIVYRA